MVEFADIEAVFAAAPANRHLGSRLVACGDDSARVALPVRPELIQEKGVVHGGFLSTLADTAAVYAIVPKLPERAGLAGVEFKLSFVRPGLPGRGEIEARSRIIKRGRTLTLVDVEVFQSDKLLAKGLFTYMVSPPRAGDCDGD